MHKNGETRLILALSWCYSSPAVGNNCIINVVSIFSLILKYVGLTSLHFYFALYVSHSFDREIGFPYKDAYL